MWNFPLVPPTAAEEALHISWLYWVITGMAIFFVVAVCAAALVLVVRYRASNENVNRDNPPESDMRLEMTWTLMPLVLALVIFFWAAKLYADIYTPRDDALEIIAIGKQWMWHVQHSNGVRENNELHIPVGRPIKVTVISQDVIHAFSLPAFRVKRDAVPGRYNSMVFTPTKTGKYHLLCTEYCGTKHSEMIGSVYVMEPDDYQKWLESGGKGTDSSSAPMSLEDQGKQIFTQLGCNTCHGAAGAAVRCPPLEGIYEKPIELANGQKVVADAEYLRESILNPAAKIVKGYDNLMPAYQGVASEDQIIKIIAYIKSIKDAKPAEASK